jgi:tetratricopeptide (TPR) repeat protein
MKKLMMDIFLVLLLAVLFIMARQAMAADAELIAEFEKELDIQVKKAEAEEKLQTQKRAEPAKKSETPKTSAKKSSKVQVPLIEQEEELEMRPYTPPNQEIQKQEAPGTEALKRFRDAKARQNMFKSPQVITPDPENDRISRRKQSVQLIREALRYMEYENNSQALKLLNGAIALDQSLAITYALRAMLNDAFGNEEASIADLNTALKLEPKNELYQQFKWRMEKKFRK